MTNLLLPCILALLVAASFGIRGTPEVNEECEACTREQRQRGLCKPCGSDQASKGKHGRYSSDHYTADDIGEDDENLRDNAWAPELRLVMIGHTGSGKSTTGNTILGENVFRAKASAQGVTTRSERGRALRFGRDIQVVDTPGLFDPSLNHTVVIKEVLRCIGMISPGPHAFLLIIPIGRFTQEHKDTVKEFEKYLGDGIMKYLIVVFTRVGDLDEPLSEYIKNVPSELDKLLKETHFRYIGFDNRAPLQQKNAKVQELLKMIKKLIDGNGGDCYTSEVFAEAEKAMKRREEEIRRQTEQEKILEKKAMQREFEEEMEKLRKQHDHKVEHLQQLIREHEAQGSGKQGQSSVATQVVELRAQLMQMEREKKQDEERRARDNSRRVDELERKYHRLEEGTREMARQDVEKEGKGFRLVWTGIKKIGKGFLQGIEGLFS